MASNGKAVTGTAVMARSANEEKKKKLGDPVDSDPTPSQHPHPKVWEEVKEVQVTPDTVTTLAFITEEPTV